MVLDPNVYNCIYANHLLLILITLSESYVYVQHYFLYEGYNEINQLGISIT